MTNTAIQNDTATWAIDAAHSTIGFAVKHLMISTVRGTFGDVEGKAQITGDDLTTADIEVEIDATAINTRNEQRDGHLRSADFFDVENHPKLTFRSTAIDQVSEDRLTVVGDLTIRGATRPVTLDVSLEGRGRDPWGGERIGFTAEGRIKRSEFGLTWNQILETGGVTVSDDVRITIESQLVRQPA